ncbi:hypothetical protein MKX01_002047 [Papaver californicum]|nr:hypothetical protein MKX01_002047 [Papaver californicum]
MQGDHHHHHHHQQHYHQELVLPCPPIRPILMDTRWKPNVELAPNCPRCDSSNTKFCYYNNYSLTQPRYFCKGCRRYWTKGGSLRNVPIGGGCRKNRKGKSVRISTSCSSPRSTSNYGGGDSSCGSLQGLNGDVSRNESFGNLVSNNNASPITNIISPSQRSDSTTTTNATIDLALVYAKYLNQQPDCTNSKGSIIPPATGTELHRDHHQFGSSFEFVENPTHHLHKPEHNNIQISSSDQEQCMFGSSTSNLIGSISNPSPGTQLSETKQVCLASHDQQQQQPEMSSNYMFQVPLQQDVSNALQDNLWLNSPNAMLTSSNFNWQSTPTQLQGFEPIIGDNSTTLHSNPLDGNWNSSFDLLPSYETFPR